MANHILKPTPILIGLMSAGFLFVSACEPRAKEAPHVTASTTPPSYATNSELAKALKSRVDGKRAVGYSAGIRTASERSFAVAGQTDKKRGIDVTPQTIFEIGSISKAFTGLILADMVLKGEIALDDPASKYLPETVKMPEHDGQAITLLDLATHHSSLPRLPANLVPADASNPYADYSVEQMYAFLSDYTLTRPIGETAEYSNLGMGLLGHILALKAGVSYEALLQDRILKPLGMMQTYIVVPKDKEDSFAIGYNARGKATSHWDLPALAGAGAIRSTGEDMMIFLEANMGLIDTPLAQAITLSHEIQKPYEPSNMQIGLAWLIDSTDDGNIIWHNGGTGGFRSVIGFNPVTLRGAFVLGNAQDDTTRIGRAIIGGDFAKITPKQENESLRFSQQELDALAGKYEMTPEFILTVTHTDGQLYVQATGQPKFPLFAQTKTDFFLKVVEASVNFIKDEKGEITSLILDQGGVQQPAKKTD